MRCFSIAFVIVEPYALSLRLYISLSPVPLPLVSISSLGDATSRQLLTVLFVASADACMGGSWSSCSDSKPF